MSQFDESQIVHGSRCEIFENAEEFFQNALPNEDQKYWIISTSSTNPYDTYGKCPVQSHGIDLVASGSQEEIRTLLTQEDGEIYVNLGYQIGECATETQFVVTSPCPYLVIMYTYDVDNCEQTTIFGLSSVQDLVTFKQHAMTHNKVDGYCRDACYPSVPNYWCAVIETQSDQIIWENHLEDEQKCAEPTCDFRKTKGSPFCYRHDD